MDPRIFSNPSGTVTLYHGMAGEYAAETLRDGFHKSNRYTALYLTDSLQVASNYAAHRAWERGNSHGVVLAVTVPSHLLKPDSAAYYILCSRQTGRDLFALYSKSQLPKSCLRPPKTGTLSLEEIGAATYKSAIDPGSIRVVKRVPAHRGGTPKDVRPVVRRAHHLER